MIPPHAQPISFDINPLLFILALADTLEPIKTCCDPKYELNIEPIEVLNNNRMCYLIKNIYYCQI